MSLRSDAKAARAAANKSVKDGESKEKQRKAAAKACELEEQVQFEDWKATHEKAGYTVEGTNFSNARVVELPQGPTYDEEPGT